MKNRTRSFWALISTQFFGAYNDNLYKFVAAFLFTKWVNDPAVESKLVYGSGLVFAAPFILFSLGAGRLADRWSKTKLVRSTKIFEVLTIAMALFGIYQQNIPIMMVALFMLATQSAFFGPAKYGILPELVQIRDLSKANGYINIFTFVAILTGSITATLITDNILLASSIMVGATTLGLISSFFMEKVPAVNPGQHLSWNFIRDIKSNWDLVKDNKVLSRCLLAVTYFWFAGAILQLNTIVYVENTLQLSEKMVGVILFVIVIGVSCGSFLTGKMSKDKAELAFVPIGCLGISVFTCDLYFSSHSLNWTLVDIFFIGFSSGLFVIPLNTLIQSRSPKSDRGRIISLVNFFSFIAVGAGALFPLGLRLFCEGNPAQVFLALGIMSFIVTILICIIIPQAVVRFVLYLLSNTIYRINVNGRDNIPINGPALLVPNHVTMVDPFLICGGMSRVPRFIMWRYFYEKAWIHPIVKLMDAIPISSTDNPKLIMKSLLTARKKLQQNHLVCIFPEGELSRLGGELQGFKKGIEVILKGMDVPVIPVHLEGLWGSIFSFKDGKFIWKWPKKLPYPVTVTFGKPLKNPNTAQMRQAIMDLGSDAFKEHRKKHPTLFSSFLKEVKRNPSYMPVVDSSGVKLTNHKLLIAATLLGQKLQNAIQEPNVGVLVPPSAGGAIANVALASIGKIPININYTLTQDAVNSICKTAGVSKIITSEKVLKKLNFEKTDQFLLLEDFLKTFSTSDKIKTALLTKRVPQFILEKTLYRHAHKNLEDLSTIMFTSGSTGIPKGVMLTEANILSNIQSLTMILQVTKDDTIMGVLPFFHSFGYTASLWFPLIAGFRAAYHTNPLDSKTIGNLCEKYSVTFLIGTPTFLSAYARKIDKEKFKSLRFAVAGAEKLRPEFAKTFEEKYSVPLLEGYGCTELSPVVALNLPDIIDGRIEQTGRKLGKIGRPIPGVSVKIVDPDTFKLLPENQPGLLLVKGPNVMKGYLDMPEKTAEVIKEGWYVTGDIAAIDEDGFIEITDRLSRFSKIGGEMVPHIMVEQKIHDIAKITERQFVVTSIPDEKKGESLVVLVAGFTGDLDALWKDLNASEMPKLWIPPRDKFFKIDEIPVLGSGKLDMQKIKEHALAHSH